jgi:hypothetical protein
MLKGTRVPLFSVALVVIAVGIVIYAYSLGGFWFGVIAMFLVWWADNDRKQSQERDRERQLIATFAPELNGMSFAEAYKYILDAVDKFKERATPESRQYFADLLAKHQMEWERRGQPMPQWATLELLRKIEAGLHE